MRAKYRLEAYATLQRPVIDVGAREHKQHVYVREGDTWKIRRNTFDQGLGY